VHASQRVSPAQAHPGPGNTLRVSERGIASSEHCAAERARRIDASRFRSGAKGLGTWNKRTPASPSEATPSVAAASAANSVCQPSACASAGKRRRNPGRRRSTSLAETGGTSAPPRPAPRREGIRHGGARRALGRAQTRWHYRGEVRHDDWDSCLRALHFECGQY